MAAPTPAMGFSPAILSSPPVTEPFNLKPEQELTEMLLRPMFVVTRRLAPPPPAEGRPVMKKDQFNLAGTILTPETKIAFLLEKATGKVRAINQGKDINGITVKEIGRERVLLTQGDEQEQLILKVVVGALVPKGGSAQPTPPSGALPAPSGAVPEPSNASAVGPGPQVQEMSPQSVGVGEASTVRTPFAIRQERARKERERTPKSPDSTANSSGKR